MALNTNTYGYVIDPFFSFCGQGGKTIANGYVRIFLAGTSTPVLTYRNFDGAFNAETIELDNSGRALTNVIASKGSLYKVCVYDAEHSQEDPILTVDKIAVLGASINATGATIVTGFDSVTVQEENFIKATVEGTSVELSLDPTEVTSEVSTTAASVTAAPDYVVPLLYKTGEGDSKKISLANLFKFALDWISRLTTTITSFASGDFIAVSNTTTGASKMSKDTLLHLTSQNALAGNVAPAFDPTRTSENPYKAGESVVYDGNTYTFKVDHYGPWDALEVEQKPISETFDLQGVGQAVQEWLDEHPEATTTVEDGSLTEPKLSDALKLQTIKDYVTPEMFGAKGDGVTDDTQALQDAFDTGKSVFISSGKTYITTGNVVGSGIVIGNGFGSRIKAASKEQPYVLKITGSNKVIKNICVHGSGDTDPSGDFGNAVGIMTEGSVSRINLDGVFIVCCGIGLYFDNTNWDSLFSRLTIYYCNAALKTDDAMLCCKFDSCSLSHNRMQFDLTRGTFVLFENCGIGSSTTEKFAKIYAARSVRFFNCNFEGSVVSSDSGAFEFLNQDNIVIFEGCYIRNVSKATGSSNTALFRTNTGYSRNSIIFRNSRFKANSVDYHVYVANGDQSLQFSFDWTSFAFMVDYTSHGSLSCNYTTANNTLFRITDVPKLRDLIDASVFGGQKFKGFQCIVGNGVRYEYNGSVFRQVPTVPETTYTGSYVLAYDSEGLFWKPDPNIYNPLNLPDYTIRFKTNAAVTQADFAKGTLSEIDGQNYIYEINYKNTDWTSVFDGNTALVEVLGANLSKVTKMYRTFFGCYNMTKCALFDTANVTTFYAAFYNCTRLESVPKFLLNKAINLYSTFHNCNSLVSLPDLDFYVVENCSLIFEDCKNVSDGDSITSAYGKLSALESVTTFGAAFQNCGSNTTDGAAALAQIPASWGGTAT